MIATIKTSLGEIELHLDAEAAPLSCENFKAYAEDGHYDNTIFHRVIPGFMIQGGGFTAAMEQKQTRDTISNEAANGLVNSIGTVAMARTPDPHSASSQFFINLADNDFLNYRDDSQAGFGYCVFGHTVNGIEVVQEIAKVATGSQQGHQDVPDTPVVIESITIVSE